MIARCAPTPARFRSRRSKLLLPRIERVEDDVVFTLLLVAGLLVVSLLLSAIVIWLSARIVRAGHPSFKVAFACGVVLTLMGAAVQLAGVAFPAVTPANQLFLGGI